LEEEQRKKKVHSISRWGNGGRKKKLKKKDSEGSETKRKTGWQEFKPGTGYPTVLQRQITKNAELECANTCEKKHKTPRNIPNHDVRDQGVGTGNGQDNTKYPGKKKRIKYKDILTN